ncbi:CDP-alcohol phosphatidyltransferase family protein [candidate division KSB1 bacterium]|nr:CDP-alcohol phosphatidyltransferase family protein [candidate division KSB1 bacterium]
MDKTLPKKIIPDRWKDYYSTAINPVINFFIRIDANPNMFTSIGFLVSIVAAYFAAKGSFRIASLILLGSGICDTIDGKVARASGKTSKFGALYDSSLDRYAEVFYFLGLAVFFVHAEWYRTSVAIFFGLGGSMMVSYVRARAEGLGFECNVGLLQRPERILLLAVGGLIHPYALVTAIWIIAIMANFTAVQRIVHIWKQDGKSGGASK